jgi:hypothetical protein
MLLCQSGNVLRPKISLHSQAWAVPVKHALFQGDLQAVLLEHRYHVGNLATLAPLCFDPKYPSKGRAWPTNLTDELFLLLFT